MKLLYILIFQLAAVAPAFAQAYHPLIRPNTNWDEYVLSVANICNYQHGWQHFFQGDSVVAGVTYQVLRSHPIVQLNPGPFCPPFAVDQGVSGIAALMREDTITQRVYLLQPDTTEALLYDFSLVAGDTLQPVNATWGHPYIVDSISTVLLMNGQHRKAIYFSSNTGMPGGYYIEGIGSASGLTNPLSGSLASWYNLECVKENGLQIYGYQCATILSRGEPVSAPAIKLYPNPVASTLYLTLPSGWQQVEVLNALGNVVARQTCAQNCDLNVQDLPQGMYLLRITDNSRKTHTERFIKTGF